MNATKESYVRESALKALVKVGAFIHDSHIVYTSGRHGSAYVDKDALYPHTEDTSRLCQAIALEFLRDGIEAVVAPEKGGIILSQWVAYHLSDLMGREVLAFYAEKEVEEILDPSGRGRKCFAETGNFVIKRGGARKKLLGKRTLVVEDVLTTGGSARRVIETARRIGGHVIGLGVLCNRGGIMPKDVADVPRLFALTDIMLDTWDEANCPFCKTGVPINTDVGKGAEFLARKQQQG